MTTHFFALSKNGFPPSSFVACVFICGKINEHPVNAIAERRKDSTVRYIQCERSYPGGNELASTTSSASFMISSSGPCSGDLGNAINPVRADSNMPNGDMSFMKASILVGFAELYRG